MYLYCSVKIRMSYEVYYRTIMKGNHLASSLVKGSPLKKALGISLYSEVGVYYTV